LHADARDVFDHARADLDQAFSDHRELELASGLVRGIAARTLCIDQNAAVWRTSRTWFAVALRHNIRSDANCALCS
jgi:hypothetical protein